MPYRDTYFATGSYYHLFNRGVDKRVIFNNDKDYIRFLEAVKYYRYSGPKPRLSELHKFKNFKLNTKAPLIEIVAYCLMPNHFHLLIKQLKEGGIQEFIAKVCNSHASYFDIKNKRKGHLFEAEFKAVLVETDEQLLHLSRYIHLNPFVANLANDPKVYKWSSCSEYFDNQKKICQKEEILNFFKKLSYKDFVMDHASYARQLHQIQHLLLE